MSSNATRLAGGLVAMALLGAACSSTSTPDVAGPATTPTTVAATISTSIPTTGSTTGPMNTTDSSTGVAPEALQFTAPLVGGGEIDMAAEFDDKPTVFWFWAPN